jgi:hypothetical protein
MAELSRFFSSNLRRRSQRPQSLEHSTSTYQGVTAMLRAKTLHSQNKRPRILFHALSNLQNPDFTASKMFSSPEQILANYGIGKTGPQNRPKNFAAARATWGITAKIP